MTSHDPATQGSAMPNDGQRDGLSSLRLAGRIENAIFQSRMPRFLLLVSLVLLIKAGVWFSFSTDRILSIARNPFVNPFEATPDTAYLLTSWLYPFLAWLLGITTPPGLFPLNMLFIAAFCALFVGYAVRTLPARDSRIAIVVLAMLPLPGDMMLVSDVDALPALLIVGILLSSRLWITLIIATLLGLQHFEQGAVAFGALLIATVLDWLLTGRRDKAMVTAAVSLAGLVLGKIGLVALFRYYHMAPETDRAEWVQQHMARLFALFILNPQYIIYSVLGVGWLVAAKFAETGRRSIAFFICLLGLMALLPIVEDETRVLAIVAFPLIFVYWLSNQAFLASLTNRFVTEMVMVWLLVPWVWVWQGKPQASAFSLDALKLLFTMQHILAPS